MKFLDRNKYALKGTNGRFFHLASIQHGVREYMCFVDKHTTKIYIEEITGGHLEFIKDESLANELAAFCTAKGVLNTNQPFMPDDIWCKMRPGDKDEK